MFSEVVNVDTDPSGVERGKHRALSPLPQSDHSWDDVCAQFLMRQAKEIRRNWSTVREK